MMAETLTDKEKADVLAQCKNILVSAGFDNIIILAKMIACLAWLRMIQVEKTYGTLSVMVYWLTSFRKFGKLKIR